MGTFSFLVNLLAAAPATLAASVSIDAYVAPAAASAQAAMIQKYDKWLTQKPAAAQTAASVPHKIAVAAATSSASCSYWLDEIAHQGVAAFNANASYAVYRNVKNYGAVGALNIRSIHLRRVLTMLQVMA